MERKNIKIILQNLCKWFERPSGGRIEVLTDFNAEIAEGEFCVILGPSGSGKTTLLRILGGLENASSGKVLIDNNLVIKPDASRGMVFQSYTCFPWLTVRGNIDFGLKLVCIEKENRRELVDHYLRLMDLHDFADFYPKDISGGMRQRVAIARTLATKPEILLMDEPFGALDNQTREDMQSLLLRAWEEEKGTVVFVTHDVEEGIFLADRVLICTQRPAKIKREVEIAFPRPREYELRFQPEFQNFKKDIVSEIKAIRNKNPT